MAFVYDEATRSLLHGGAGGATKVARRREASRGGTCKAAFQTMHALRMQACEEETSLTLLACEAHVGMHPAAQDFTKVVWSCFLDSFPVNSQDLVDAVAQYLGLHQPRVQHQHQHQPNATQGPLHEAVRIRTTCWGGMEMPGWLLVYWFTDLMWK